MDAAETGFNAPRGMRDFYPEEMAVRSAIFDAWRASAELHGFAAYDSCVVENLDLLKRKAGEEIVDQIYAFQDKSGRDLALRPEMTPTLARMIAARQAQLAFPLKWYAIAQCFRYERMTRGRKREHYQWNLDIVGEPSPTAEAEVISTAVTALRRLTLTDQEFEVRFSSRAILAELLAKLGLPGSAHQAAFMALDKRGKMPDTEVADMLRAAGISAENADRVLQLLGISSFETVAGMVGEESPACRNVRSFCDLLQAYGLSEVVRFDLSVVRGLSYYTGIVFEAFDSAREFRAIFGGGRYDHLLQDIGGQPATAVGLGFGDVVIAEILAAKNRTIGAGAAAGTTVGYMEDAQRPAAIAVATALRRRGEVVDLALRSEKPKSFFSRAGKRSFRHAIYIGPDDVAAGTLRVKDLLSRTEREVPLADM